METEEVEVVEVNKVNQEDTEYFIPVLLPTSSTKPTLSIHSRGKYYKQTYRAAWEHMPDFKGWLKGVEGEPTRAYCTYCHKNLHAHMNSLLKHTCTIRHQKAAQLNSARKSKIAINMKESISGNEDDKDVSNEESELEEEDDERSRELKPISESTADQNVEIKLFPEKPPISTQVMDMMKGKPISGLQVSLYKLIDGRWTFVNEGMTNSTGKFSEFMDRPDFTNGRYKLHYDVDRYFEAKKQETIYPFIEIIFNAGCTESHHIPLLLSPFGYTTYKGT